MCAQVAIVHHLDMPIMRQRAFHIAPGTENQIPITPTLYTANPQVQRGRDQHGDYHWVPVVLWFQYKCYDLIWNCVVWYEIAGSQVPSLLDLKELNRNLRWLAVAVLTWTFCISLGQDSGRGAAAAPNIWERWNFNSISILSLNKMYYFESYNIRQLHKLSNL